MSTLTKEFLSASTNGRGIKIAATATAGTLLHTAHASAKDKVWVYLSNTSASDVVASIEFGGTTSPDDIVKVTVPAAKTILAIPGLIVSGGLAVRCFAAAANVLSAFGEVDRLA